MKMLLIGSFGIGAIENIYLYNFKRLGWQVEIFDIQTPYFHKLKSSIKNRIINRFSIRPLIADVNKEIIIYSERIKPDVTFIFKGMELFPETVEELGFHCKVMANYNPDHPLKTYSRGSGNSNIDKSLSFYDLHFSYAKNIVNQLKKKLRKEACWIPFGYDEQLIQNSFIKTQYPFVIFVGAYDKERLRFFKDLGNQGIKVFGDKKWNRLKHGSSRESPYQGKSLYNDDYLYYTTAAKGSINLLRKQNIVEQSHNMRTFEVPGYGGMLISQRTVEQQEFFEDRKEAVFFDNKEELTEILKDIRQLKLNVNKIKANARKRSERSNYSYFYRAKMAHEVIESLV